MPKVNFGIRGAICLLFVFLPLHSLDQWFYDQFFRLRGATHRPTQFLLVRVNDAKLYPYFSRDNGAFPSEALQFSPRTHAVWNAEFYNELARRILAQNPRLMVFSPYYQWEDQKVAAHFDPDRVLFASALNEQNQLIPPKPNLVRGDNYGFSNLFPDRDNVVRQTHLVYSSGASLALRIYHRLTDKPIKRNLLDPMRIDFRGPSGSYPSVEASDVLDGTVAPNLFEGKVVLIGKESSSFTDFETPLGKMSALEIQANGAETFVSGREIRILPQWVTWGLAVLAVAASIAIILAFPLTLAWLFLLLLSLVIVLVTLFAFSQFKIWWGVGNPIFCIFATHLLMLGYKLSRQEEQQWKTQQEAEYLREMDQFKNNFISLFSHDLKTPIAKIRAITNRMLGSSESPLAAPTVEAFQAIDRTNNDLARLISDILRVTKMESMSLEAKRDVVDLNRLVEVAVSRHVFLAEEKKIKLVADLEPLFSMEGDPDLLQEVITNLLENAIKYSRVGSQVIVRTSEEELGVRVSVTDQGMGIAADEIPRVTGKFYRGRDTEKTTKGSGLGLYLAKYFVELHKGTLEIQSDVGKGTTVSFLLPLSK